MELLKTRQEDQKVIPEPLQKKWKQKEEILERGHDQVGYYYREYAHDQIGNYFIYNFSKEQWETLPNVNFNDQETLAFHQHNPIQTPVFEPPAWRDASWDGD